RSHRDGHRLGGGEVERGQRHLLVERVPASAPRRGVDRHAGLLQRRDVALDRTDAHLDARGRLGGRTAARRDGAQVLDERVEPVGAVHACDGTPRHRQSSAGPLQELVQRPGVDDPLRLHPALGGPLAAETLPVELAGRTIRPVQWPSTSTRGFAIAVTILRVISVRSIRSWEWTLATTTSSRSSSSGSWSRLPSGLMSTSIPVSTRNGASPRLTSATASSWARSRSADRPRATVRRGEWSVSA